MPQLFSDIELKGGASLKGRIRLLTTLGDDALYLYDTHLQQVVARYDNHTGRVFILGSEMGSLHGIDAILQGQKVDIKGWEITIGDRPSVPVNIHSGNLSLLGSPSSESVSQLLGVDPTGKVFRTSPMGGSQWHDLYFISPTRPGSVNINNLLNTNYSGSVHLSIEMIFSNISNTQYRLAGHCKADMSAVITDDLAGFNVYPSSLKVTSHSGQMIRLSSSGGAQVQYEIMDTSLFLSLTKNSSGVLSLNIHNNLNELVPSLNASFDAKYTLSVRQFSATNLKKE